MEMCCEGALSLPCSYVVMNEEEMTYVEGGATVKQHKNSWGGIDPMVYDVYFNNKECKKIADSATPIPLIAGMMGKYGPVLACIIGCYSWTIGKKNKGKGVVVTVNLQCPIIPYATVKTR